MAAKVKYNINLQSLAKKAYQDKGSQFVKRAQVIAGTMEFKLTYGQLAINEVVRRTQRGLDKNDVPLAVYATTYKNSLAFQIYGKSSSVNMTLSGEMLSSMKVVPLTNGINLEMIDGFNNDKAHGHINGTISKNGKIHLPVRDFFGLTEEREIKLFKTAITQRSDLSILNEISNVLRIDNAAERVIQVEVG